MVLDAHCGVGYALWCYVCYAAYVTCTLQCNSICMLPENPLHNQTHDTHTITCTLKHFNNLCCHLPRSFLCSFLAITLTPTPPVSGKPGALPTPDFVISSVATFLPLFIPFYYTHAHTHTHTHTHIHTHTHARPLLRCLASQEPCPSPTLSSPPWPPSPACRKQLHRSLCPPHHAHAHPPTHTHTHACTRACMHACMLCESFLTEPSGTY